MNTTLALARPFHGSHYTLTANLEGITEDEALTWPKEGGNCINWVLGHIVYTRKVAMSEFDGEKVPDDDPYTCYISEFQSGEPVEAKEHEADFLPLERLITDLHATQEPLLKAINAVDTSNAELVETLATLGFHESYHAGQVGLLRRVLGKEGKIK